MDPNLQDFDPSETFAGRIAGLEELRNSAGGDSWSWRDKAIDDALKGGRYLETRFHAFVLEINQKVSDKASAKLQADMMLDVAALKGESQRRQRVLAWVAGICAGITIGLAVLVIQHWWK